MQNPFTTVAGLIVICVLLLVMAVWPAVGAVCVYVRAFFAGSPSAAMLRIATGAPRDYKSVKMR